MLGLGSAITYISGLFGGFINATATSFDGTDDTCKTSGAPSELTVNNSSAGRGWSISAWIYVPSGSMKILGKHQAWQASPIGAYFSEFYLFIDYARRFKLKLWGSDGSGNMYTSGGSEVSMTLRCDTAVTANNWYHIVYTYDLGSATDSIVGYVDGVKFEHGGSGGAAATLTTTGTWSAPVTTSCKFIVNNPQQAVGTANFDEFSADEIATFDEVLTQAQVDDLYGDGTPGDAAVVSSYVTGLWRMGDGDTHPTITDHSGNGNDLTMTNMASDDFVTGASK